MVRILLKSSACNHNSFRGRGVFYSKLVIPAQAGIQKCFAEKLEARLPEHDGKIPRLSNQLIRKVFTEEKRFQEAISKIGFWFKIPSSPKSFAGTRAAGPNLTPEAYCCMSRI
jgi:hypothetical protein